MKLNSSKCAFEKLRPYFRAHPIVVLTNQPLRSILEGVVDSTHRWSLPNLRIRISNNEAEYEAILSGLNLALALSASKLEICSDSQLVLNEWAIKRIPRTRNVQVDALVGIATTLPCQEEGTEWTREIENYLRTRDLPEESKHAHKVRMQATRFTLIGDRLYRRSFGGPYLICLDSRKAQYVLLELYEGICGSLT
ncbi:hypothetical protein AAG906_025093 [Vitis piasezkii]